MDRNEEASSTCSMEKSPEKRIVSHKKKKKKRKTSTICTDYCRYSVIRRIAKVFNMKEVGKHDEWNVCWTDSYVPPACIKNMKRFQRVNHFPGMSAICRKDQLARNLNRMLKLFPKDYNFYPKTWCLTADLEELLTYSRNHRNKTYIFKPHVGSRGKGIFLTKNLKDVKSFEKLICQLYISKPFIMDGLKFDLRVYVLITSCDPLRIYVYNEGLARFATSPYSEPATNNSTNIYMHLTNYSVNKHSRMFVVDDIEGSKRRISTVNAWLNSNNHDVTKIWAAIDDMIVKTLISAYPTLKHSYHKSFPCHKSTYACFELLGFDVLLDNKLKPHLLEVNHSPSFNTEAELDKEVKESLFKDTFRILNLSKCYKKRLKEEDKQQLLKWQMQDIQKKKGSLLINESTLSASSPSETHKIQMKWEENHLGNYRQVYPSTVAEKYSPYLKQTQSSMFKETVTSRARGEAGKLQREEFELNLREETARMSDINFKLITSESTALQKPKLMDSITREKPPSTSFDRMPTIESDEKGLLAGLSQIESLLRCCHVIDQVNVVLLNKALETKIKKKQITSKISIVDAVDWKLSTQQKKTDSEENATGTILKPPLPISECHPEENTTGTMLKPPLPISECHPEENAIGPMLEPPLPISECHPEENATGPMLEPPLPISECHPEENATGPMLEPLLPISECHPEENATGPMLESPLPISLTTEASVKIRPGDLPVSTERPTTLGGKTTNTSCPSNTVKLQGKERRCCPDKKPAWR